MNFEICTVPFRRRLYGYGSERPATPVADSRRGAAAYSLAKPLMDRMWQAARELGLKTHGLNHWVYLPDGTIFTGLELQEPAQDLGTLQRLEIALERHVKYVHVGPYGQLAACWRDLLAAVTNLGERPNLPHLEIYGHWQADETKCETTLLFGLGAGP